VVEEVEHPATEGVTVDDVERHHDRAVVVTLRDGLLAELLHHPAGAGRVDEHGRSPGLILAVRERVGPDVLPRVHVGGRHEGVGCADHWFALDPVDAERARRVAVAVVADHVPVAEAKDHAVGLEVRSSPR
jgi:hypothetical protein